MYIFLTTYQTVHLKWEHFIVCKSHLNEVDLKIRIGKFIEMESRLEISYQGLGVKGTSKSLLNGYRVYLG